MTTPIAPGDLVLRDGKAEEVKSKRYQPHPGVMLLQLSDWVEEQLVTRIGSTHDGWRIHANSERPEGVGAEDRVEVFGNDGIQWSEPMFAGDVLVWKHLAAYRIVQRAEPPISGQGENCGVPGYQYPSATALMAAQQAQIDGQSRQPSASELQAVAAEMRKLVSYPTGRGECPWTDWERVVEAWADRIDPPEPEPLKVGDRVRHAGRGGVGVVCHLFVGHKGDDRACVSFDEPAWAFRDLHMPVTELERIP